MKNCKYCKETGQFDPVTRKVLCKEHVENQRQFKAIWEAITELRLSTEEQSPSGSSTREDTRTPVEEREIPLIRFLENDR